MNPADRFSQSAAEDSQKSRRLTDEQEIQLHYLMRVKSDFRMARMGLENARKNGAEVDDLVNTVTDCITEIEELIKGIEE